MPKTKNKLGPLSARAAFSPESFNEEDRTVEVTFGTETPVRMYDWERGAFMETMSFDESHVRMGRLNGGAPVLDNHDQYKGVGGVLAVVEKAWIEKGEGRALLKFSAREEVEPVFQDVKDGILRGISFGYRVYKYEEETSEEGELPKLRAIDWEPFEISFAPIQADAGASVRNSSKELGEVEIIPLSLPSQVQENKRTTMSESEKEAAKAAKANEEKQRNAAEAKTKEAVEAATATEKKRAAEITSLCRKHNVKSEDEAKWIDESNSVDEVRTFILDGWVKEDPNEGQRSQAKVTADGVDKFRKAATESVTLRVSPGTEAKEGGDEFRGMTLLDLGKECITNEGGSTRGLSRREISQRALSTSDFPIILGDAVNRQLRAKYDLQERTFTKWASRGTARDFRDMNKVAISELVKPFGLVAEGGEYEEGTLTEGKETYSVAKYGQIINLTWESLVNDDLSAFDRIPAAIAAQAAQKQSDLVYAILTGNPDMGDGTALFHADHGNLGTDGDISDTTLQEMRKMFRQQTTLSGQFLNVAPKYLIVGPDMEHLAQKYMNAAFSPATVANTNIFQGTMEVVAEGRITDEDWFAAAAPGAIDTVEYSFLEGEGELFTEQQQGFDSDGLKIKARMVFGAKAIDHRGLFKNPNA